MKKDDNLRELNSGWWLTEILNGERYVVRPATAEEIKRHRKQYKDS